MRRPTIDPSNRPSDEKVPRVGDVPEYRPEAPQATEMRNGAQLAAHFAGCPDEVARALGAWDGTTILRIYPPRSPAGHDVATLREQRQDVQQGRPFCFEVGSIKVGITNEQGRHLMEGLESNAVPYLKHPAG